MPAVFTFWCLPEEEDAFFDFLGSWDIYVYPQDTFPEKGDVVPVSLNERPLRAYSGQFSFGPKKFLSQKDVDRRNVVDGKYYHGVSPVDGCVLTFSRAFFHETGQLGKANLSAYWKYNYEGLGLDKNSEFVKWGKSVFKWLRNFAHRKQLLNGFAYPATERVASLAESGKLILGN